MSETKRAYLELHLAVLLFGFTAILGNLIQLNALVLVWWRVGITSASLLYFFWRERGRYALSRRDVYWIIGIGVLVTVHWICFYGAIKVSNASIALVSFATTAFFTAILEPLISRRRPNRIELGLGLLIVPAMILIVDSVPFSQVSGIILGLLSAVTAALFSTLNKIQVSSKQVPPFTLTFIQLGSSWVLLTLLLLPYKLFSSDIAFQLLPARGIDWVFLLLLSLACTTLGYVLTLRALRHISAFASSLAINMEPVYGITLAWVLLGENKQMSAGFYYGSAIIVVSVFLYPLVRRRTAG